MEPDRGDVAGRKKRKVNPGDVGLQPGSLSRKKKQDKKLHGNLLYQDRLLKEAESKAQKTREWLSQGDAGTLEAEGLERTWRFKQDEILQEVGTGAARNVLDLQLPDLGPYCLDFTRNGRYSVLGGKLGHIAVLELSRHRLVCEVQVRERVRDVQFLHNETMFAVAQKKYVYIYNHRGQEIHCLKGMTAVQQLDFLPYHFLLCAIGKNGKLIYQDTSTGQVVAQHATKLGSCEAMRQNPWNAVVNCGHGNGQVTMWTPNMGVPVVKLQCHRGPVRALAVDKKGTHMVTAGADGQVKVWDVRTFQPLHAYFSRSPATTLDISQNGLLAIGAGSHIQIWKDALLEKQEAPYMTHRLANSTVQEARFCPYEDVLGLGHSMGLSSILVPGAGEPNFDAFVANPFQQKQQRRQQEVHQLLDKLQPEMISLNMQSIGQVAKAAKKGSEEEEPKPEVKAPKLKNKMKGRNTPSKKYLRKHEMALRQRQTSFQQPQKEVQNRTPSFVDKSSVPRVLKSLA